MGLNQTWAKLIGIVLVLVGILGFFMGDNVFGFEVNTVHNVVHIVTGLIALWAGFSASGSYAKTYNIIFGLVYLVVAIAGFMNFATVVDLLAINSADNWLHIVIAVVSLGVGFFA